VVGSESPPQDAAIRTLVGRFYDQVRQDPVLAPVFMATVGGTDAAWAAHLDRITDFWSSIMHGSGRYHGDPFSAHLRLPGLQPAMFERWLALFRAACDETLDPDLAAAFSSKADRIARSLQMGLSVRSQARPAHGPAPPSPGPPAG
jgi:hemoglobin